MVKGSRVEGWAGPCRLDEELLQQKVLTYEVTRFDFVSAGAAYLTAESSNLLSGHKPAMQQCDLGRLHTVECKPPDETAPPLQRAQVQASLSRAANSAEKSRARKAFKSSAEWTAFCALYRRFIKEWVLPQFGVDLLYQSTPVLRVVMPGSVPPCKPHCDADYFHDPNEVPAVGLALEIRLSALEIALSAAFWSYLVIPTSFPLDRPEVETRISFVHWPSRCAADQLLAAAFPNVCLKHTLGRVEPWARRLRPFRAAAG